MSASRTTFAAAMEHNEALNLENISKTYQGKQVLEGVSVTVNAGEVFGLVGPNGAGKTTLMKIIAGLSRPGSGRITIFGRDGLGGRAAVKHRLGWVPQENNLERELSVREALLLYALLYGVPSARLRVKQIMAEFNLADISGRSIGMLSGGMARRVLIARAVLPEPQMLLLDEPSVGLDPDVRQDIWQVIRLLAGKGKTIFLTTHYMDEAEQLCDRLALLKAGRILVTGTPAGIKSMAAGAGDSPGTLEEAFLRLIRRGAE
ncbi:ABC transporter ATP-binding protein [Sporomusa aerivorans]|uniref:ABC transporter ATP-binding protein n=1 Tax=Sporomusa aerivorans TaxID=204936 RepID=UPI003529FBAD